MAKKDLMKRLEEPLEEKKMPKIELMMGGKVDRNCNKPTIEDAIKRLEDSDEETNGHLTVVKLKCPNIYKTVVNNGNWLVHSHNRYAIYTMAKTALA